MTSTNIDFWFLSRNQSVVSVPPEVQVMFEDRLNIIGAPYDIDTLLSNEDECESDDSQCELKRSTRQTSGFYKRFHRYSAVSPVS